MRTVRGLLVLLILTAVSGGGRAVGSPPAVAGSVHAPGTAAPEAVTGSVPGPAAPGPAMPEVPGSPVPAVAAADSARAAPPAPALPAPALPDSGKTGRPLVVSRRVAVGPATVGAASAGPAAADSGRWVARVSASPDSVRTVRSVPDRPWYRRPRWIMIRSGVVPGWGQWANGRHVKAAVVAAGEGYLLWRAVDYGRQEQAKWGEVLAATDPAARASLERRHRRLGAHRRDFTWWSVFAALLSVGDAYVDAQLGNFDAEFEPQDRAGLNEEDAGWRAAVTLRW